MDLKILLKNKLKRLDESNAVQTKECNLELEEKLFKQYLSDFGKKEGNATIPKFYSKLPKPDELLRQKLREESISHLLEKKKEISLLENDELKKLWSLLDQHQSYPDEQMLTYSDYKKLSLIVSPSFKPYFTAILFAKLQQGDSQGRIFTTSVFNYIMRKVWFQQTRVGLSWYDSSGQGYLREDDMEGYITELLPTLPQLEGLEKSFHNFYVCTAVRKFFFFLDVLRSGRIKISDILACSFLDELLELREEGLSKEVQAQNWFSAPSALRIYGQYLNLDRDHNGMLNKSELAGYGSGTLTQPFLDRVFQTCLTYGGEMDYKTYLDLVLALENRSEPQALAYLFRIIDINGQQYLDSFTLNYFFKAIQDQMIAHGAKPIPFLDVKDELFDMAKPKDPEKITLDDLIACGQGDVFINILIDFQGFWAYENREAVAPDGQD